MDLETRKHEFIQKLLNVEESVFDKLESFLNKSTSRGISLSQYNKEIDEANARIDAGDFLTQEEVEKIANQW
ncbi:hypothetical protein N9K49_02935 [Flavobacteriaceae bacterium]|jgi:hypothetical protein|uniref:hypothetical protein n=1 Tax=Formosa sp. Hel1_33_131 TaxID=1336794 RepID=UPI00084E0BA9|nr:hypothetical protein [Formosa sp. Hel1_33_131]AOR29154.1 hypothetical protein FORMB_21260 [Formosa sp. Hel1_33_131]MDA9056777.1 hypothetical protein [Flavobacteriaceae bacterium]